MEFSTGRNIEIDFSRILFENISKSKGKPLRFITKSTYIYLFLELNLSKLEILEFLKFLGLSSTYRIKDFKVIKPKELEIKVREEIYFQKTGYTNPSLVPEIANKISKNIKKAIRNDPKIIERRLKTLGEDGIKKISQKTLETKKERYGNSKYNNREKAKETTLKNYGVENPSQAQEIKSLKKETLLRNYGVENIFELPEVKNKIKQTNFRKYGVSQPLQNLEIKKKALETFKRKSTEEKRKIAEKVFNTKKEKKNLNTSKNEEIIYQFLLTKFPDTKTQYKSEKYPFACDFYIPSEDLYIEYNENWTHGFHPFNKNNSEDLKQLEIWKEKSEEINFRGEKKLYYLNAVKVWSEKDVKKREIACKNKLYYLEFFNKEEFMNWFNKI